MGETRRSSCVNLSVLVVCGRTALSGRVVVVAEEGVTSEARGGPPVRSVAMARSVWKSVSNVPKLVMDSRLAAPKSQSMVPL